MENAGKMEEMEEREEEDDSINSNQEVSKPVANRVVQVNEFPKNESYTKKGKRGRSVLVKQEERETGIVSGSVLTRYFKGVIFRLMHCEMFSNLQLLQI